MEGIALLSGGKDSVYAMYIAMQQGIKIKKIINIYPEKFSLMYHFPNVHLINLISQSLDIDFAQYKISDEPNELQNILSTFEEKIVVTGAIESEYQKTRLEQICTKLEKIHYSPLWKKDPFKILSEILQAGFRVIFVSVSAEGLGDDFLGSELNYNTIERLKRLKEKYGIHPSGEGGEYETLVLDGPIYKSRIKIDKWQKEWYGNFGLFKIVNAHIEKK
ncbi:MAG: diphthine--ammonia ligase [Thermoplasmata archaeon]